MKKLLLALLCLLTFTISSAQSNNDFAKIYIKRAKQAIETDIDFSLALVHLNKAMNRMDTITDRKIASLASLIYFENHHNQASVKEQLAFLKKSEGYSKQYFLLAKNKESEEYINNLESLILIQETLEELVSKEKKQEEERIRKEVELRKIDSLKTVWNNKSATLSVKVDSIYNFNKYNIALYTKNNNFGIINDKAEVILTADEYKAASNFEGFILLKNKIQEPTKIYCFNTKTNTGFLLPNPSDFNSLSTHYGKVMLPRGNGRLVMYPNNSYKPMVYDLNVKKMVKISNQQDLFKNLKKNDIIDKYKKDGKVKVNKEWYQFGGHLGGGIHPLYSEDNYQVHSFLCSVDGNVLKSSSDYQHIGAFYNNKFQAINGDNTMWINQNGTKVSAAKDEAKEYKGNSKVVKIDSGVYQITKDGVIILGNEKLVKMSIFLREFSAK
ncbi:MAG: hypothetical protein V3V28_05785 [Polaribacter sp.]|uniref:hypothetical protein n=1 Tax=Polaribacter sp. TaxID=1920175 RepID=UPI002F3532F8